MILESMGYALGILMLVVILLDVIPQLADWVGRIHIGRFDNEASWNEAITDRGIQWLRHTPKIKVTDNTRFVVIDILKGNYTKAAIQHWQEASLLLGMAEYLRHHDDPRAKQQIRGYVSKTFDANGGWVSRPEHIDGAILAYALMKLDFLDPDHYKPALDATWEMIQEHIGQDGTVEYRKYMKSYRYVDTIGFICPFLVAYGLRYGKEECIELAVKQIKEYERYGLLEQHDLPCHVYKLDNKAPLGLYGWGRGLGWFAIGLIDAWNELPQAHKHKSGLEEIVRKFAKAAIRFQQSGGHWNWTVTRGETRPDSSATATLGWFLLHAARIDSISEECMASAYQAIRYLMKVTRRNGAVDFSQGDTKDIGVYSTLFNILPFTQGFCIRCIHAYRHQAAAYKKTA
ncbi:glycoside hydrolase family 88 protein [Paenibacillus rigui]|uniref:Glycoside hydrolase 105 family protein n=1 Tax=Paenibacillus rigui TaxID=554312 RepID=A0A229UPL5_9BACL|nr:glycoside hydrolase family 88 protein [Paenibacillus rigui]OXM85221.1 hypothetical protein CF651_16620 [Paenibacillus rigui]